MSICALIASIKASHSKSYRLFFDEKRIGEEFECNLVSITMRQDQLKNTQKSRLVNLLTSELKSIGRRLKIEYPSRTMNAYLWFDEPAKGLRWTVVSEVGSNNSPFSSMIKQVTIEGVVENWISADTSSVDETRLDNELSNITASELRELLDSSAVPTLEVAICVFR